MNAMMLNSQKTMKLHNWPKKGNWANWPNNKNNFLDLHWNEEVVKEARINKSDLRKKSDQNCTGFTDRCMEQLEVFADQTIAIGKQCYPVEWLLVKKIQTR